MIRDTRVRAPFLRQSSKICAVAALIALTASSAYAQTAQKPGGETLGFVISRFYPAIYRGENNCPQGLTLSPQQSFLAQQTPAERERLQRPENAAEFERGYKVDFVTGFNGEEMCRFPRGFANKYKHPADRLIEGKTSYGLNLDGDDGTGPPPEGICKHENFTSPEGEPGIDNQLFRANGCMPYFRGSLTDPNLTPGMEYLNRLLREGLHTIVIEVTGVDDRLNDDDIQVGVYSSPDKPVQVGNTLMHDATLTITPKTKWHNVYKGRIVNGKIKTDVKDLRLNMEWSIGGERGASEEYDLRRARFELEVLPNGELKGLMGAYQDPYNMTSIWRLVGAASSNVAAFECASEYNRMELVADAFPDPVTGKCTMLSVAYEVNGVPAFLIHPDASAKTAQSVP